MIKCLTELNPAQLRRAAEIKEQLEKLELELGQILDNAETKVEQDLTFQEAVAVVTKGGLLPKTRQELEQELPRVYSGKSDAAALRARLYSKGIKHRDGKFWANTI